MFENWVKNGGNLSLLPLVGWETGVAPKVALLQVQYVYSQEQLESGEAEPLQLALTAEQCRLLAKALVQMADEIDAQ